jgi:hypothetical protein
MAHMAKEPYTLTIWPVVLLAAYLVAARLHLLSPALLAWGLFVIVSAAYLQWVVAVVDQICNYLDINCLTIKAYRHTS